MMNMILASALLSSAGGLPEVGRPAPAFEGPATDGTTVKLSELKGTWVVLCFYPKSFTPGCTAEACALRDGFTELQKAGVRIYGVSLDGMETQKKFKAEYRLPFELLSDSNKAMSKAYGTLGMMGLYADRKTFIIDPEGEIAHIFDMVNPKTHDKDVLEVMNRMKAKG